MTISDIWGDDATEMSLWTARLFPKVSLLETETTFSHLRYLWWFVQSEMTLCVHCSARNCNGDIMGCDDVKCDVNGILKWKNMERLSLSDILSRGNAATMVRWRLFVQAIYQASVGDEDTKDSDTYFDGHNRIYKDMLTSSPFRDTEKAIHVFEISNRVAFVIKTLWKSNSDASSIGLMLALWCVRVCHNASTCIVELIDDVMYENIQHIILQEFHVHCTKEEIVIVLHDFDKFWNDICGQGHGACRLVMYYLVNWYHFVFDSGNSVLNIIRVFVGTIEAEQYPRLVFVLHWLNCYNVFGMHRKLPYSLSNEVKSNISDIASRCKMDLSQKLDIGILKVHCQNILESILGQLLKHNISGENACKSEMETPVGDFLEWVAQV